MVNDPYAEARAIAKMLRLQQRHEWSSKIEDIIAGGSTATEILMGLRWILGELLRDEPLDGATATRARELEKAVDALLQ